MPDPNRRRMEVNRRSWDESVPLHVASRSYDVPAFKRGRLAIHPIEVTEVGPVRGRSLLHLQCHFGMDTLSWARLGAHVTGVDFSPPAVAAARLLSAETGLRARFIESNVYDLPGVLEGKFDIVYTGKGAICWLPDLTRWAQIVAHFLKPGGRFYLMEDHPIAELYANGAKTTSYSLQLPYFGGRPLREESEGTYAVPNARLKHNVSYSWIHPVSETLGALIDAGLRLESVHEFPFSYWRRYPFLQRRRDGWWHSTKNDGMVPLMWTVRARKTLAG